MGRCFPITKESSSFPKESASTWAFPLSFRSPNRLFLSFDRRGQTLTVAPQPQQCWSLFEWKKRVTCIEWVCMLFLIGVRGRR